MKTKITEMSYEEVMNLEKQKHQNPIRPNLFFRTLLKLVSLPDMIKSHFTCHYEGMEKLGKDEPCIILMNHSAFLDLEILTSVLYPRPINIVASNDAFFGKDWLMRHIGCIPTKKYVHDLGLVRDIKYSIETLKTSVAIFPEAGYSMDGAATAIGESMGKMAKLLNVPIVMIKAEGVYLRDPLYNNLQIRKKVNTSATVKYLLSPDDIKSMTSDEINEIVQREFTFDYFTWQKENKVVIDEPFRADYLNRVLFKCPHCMKEGNMEGRGIHIRCKECGVSYTLDELGYLKNDDGETKFDHIPTWYAWQRSEIKKQIENDEYHLDIPVDICCSKDTKNMYHIGEGRLTHNRSGFVLEGVNGELHYEQKSLASYSLCADFYFYEIGDVVVLGNNKMLYYLFPKCEGDVVAKIRIAQEELYKIISEEHRIERAERKAAHEHHEEAAEAPIVEEKKEAAIAE